MKACGCCGRDNDDELAHCRECGTEFPVLPVQADARTGPRLVDLDRLEGAFDFDEGFSRPDWKVIRPAVESAANPEDRRDVWDDVVEQWLTWLKGELGGGYRLIRSRHFILLADIETEAAHRLLNSAENAMSSIRSSLNGVVWHGLDGSQVLLFFSEEDDYYQYISGFYPGGTHPKSGGIYIFAGYPHIALHFDGEVNAAQTVVHELTHHALNGLVIPLWLNEGMAVVLQKIIGGRTSFSAWQELIDRHHKFWNEAQIQHFWAGTSFHEPGDAVELSYSLAEILVSMLVKDRDAFLAFIRSAQPAGAGQTAALDCLESCLGDAVGTFLGEGNWRPQRKAIKACWEAERAATKKSDEAGVA
jgi:hypothetical protein